MPQADANPSRDRNAVTPRFRVVRWVFAFSAGTIALVGYLATSRWNLARFDAGLAPITLFTSLDHHIPFVPLAFWAYVLYYLLAISPTFLACNWRELLTMAVAYGTASVIAWLTWVVLPVRMMVPPLHCAGLTCRLLVAFQEGDGGVNVFPSLHVAHTVLAAAFHVHHRSRVAPLVLVGTMLVVASTVLIRQHYLVDLPAGALTAAIGWWMARLTMGLGIPARERA